MDSIKKKLLNKTAILGVVGLGYVGLPLAVEKAKAGFRTIGFDVQESKVDMVNAGNNYIGDVVNEDLKEIMCFVNKISRNLSSGFPGFYQKPSREKS